MDTINLNTHSKRDVYNEELRILIEKQKDLENQIRKLNLSEMNKTREKTEDEDINIGNLVKVEDSPREAMDIKMELEENNFCCKGRFCF